MGPGPRGWRAGRGDHDPPSTPLRASRGKGLKPFPPTGAPGGRTTVQVAPVPQSRRRWLAQNPGGRAIQCDFPYAISDPQDLVRRGPCGGTPLLRARDGTGREKIPNSNLPDRRSRGGGGILNRAAVNDARCKSLSWYSRGVCRRLRRCIAVSVRVYYMGLIILQRAQSLGQEYTTEEEGPPAPPAWVLLWHFRDEQGSFRPRNSGD